MPPPKKGTWTTNSREVTFEAQDDGGFIAIVPLLDEGVKQGDLRFTMTADRELTIYWEEVADAISLSDFQAWWKEA